MNSFSKRVLRFVSAIAFVLPASIGVAAQSTIFNVPSTDVQTHKSLYVEADFTGHFSSFEAGGYQTYGTRLVYGLNRRVEIGFNAFFTRTSPAEPVEIQPNFKVQLYQNESSGVALSAGATFFIPVTQRSESGTRAMTYIVGSKSIRGSYGPRMTAGAYALIGSFEPATTKHGALFGFEQPITQKLSFVVDWSSGKNDYGYAAAGFGITVSPKSLVYVGYNFGNQGRGNNALGIYYGYSF